MKSTAESTASTARKLGLNSETWTYRFTFEGRRYTLVKRKPGREGAWYLDTIIRGTRIARSLETNDAGIAKDRAISSYITPARTGRWEEIAGNKARQDFATIGALLTCYREVATGLISKDTIHHNVGSFHAVVRRANLGKEDAADEEVDALSTSILTGRLVADFEEWMTQLAIKQGRNLESNKRTVKGYLRQMRSVFNKDLIQRYPEKGIKLPDLNEFMTRRTAKPARVVKVPPPDGLLDRTCTAAIALKQQDHEAYIAWLLGFYSLRRGEIDKMQFSWLIQVDGQSCVRVPLISKSKAFRDVPIDPLVVRELTEWRTARKVESDDAFVLPGPPFQRANARRRIRCDGLFKRVNEFMRGLGWNGRQTLHALRAEYLRRIRRRFGLDAAQAIGGHSDSRTTEDSYTGTPQAEAGMFIAFPTAASPSPAPLHPAQTHPASSAPPPVEASPATP